MDKRYFGMKLSALLQVFSLLVVVAFASGALVWRQAATEAEIFELKAINRHEATVIHDKFITKEILRLTIAPMAEDLCEIKSAQTDIRKSQLEILSHLRGDKCASK